MSKHARPYLNDILNRIHRIESYTASGFDAFKQSAMIQDAVIRSFEVIGEAVKRLDESVIAQQPQIPWSDYAGFRDVLIHQYERVVLDLVWQFSQEDLPALKTAVTALLDNLENRDEAP